MVKILDASPIVSRATIAAINKPQVNISIRAKVPKMSFGFASILKAYWGLWDYPVKRSQGLSVEIAFVVTLIIRTA
jgi:hypothetical protein